MLVRLFVRIACISSLALAAACGDDKGGTDTDNSSTSTTAATTTAATTTAGMTTTAATTTDTSAGTMGPTSNPTTGGPGGGMFCLENCAADDDCKVMGMDLGLICDNSICTGDSGGCTDNLDCTAQFSGWVIDCASDTDCPGQVCVDVHGAGKCATAPGMGITCDLLGQVELMEPAFGGGGMVTVCGNDKYECKNNVCTTSCKADADCMVPGLPHCNTNTGACECSSDADCVAGGVMGQTVCKTNFCGCGSDADCMGNPNADTCYEGFCGCSGDAVCTNKAFDGTTVSCKSP